MMPETPRQRIEMLVTLMEKALDDVEILMEEALMDEEAQELLSRLAEKIMRLPYEIQRKMARRLAVQWP